MEMYVLLCVIDAITLTSIYCFQIPFQIRSRKTEIAKVTFMINLKHSTLTLSVKLFTLKYVEENRTCIISLSVSDIEYKKNLSFFLHAASQTIRWNFTICSTTLTNARLYYSLYNSAITPADFLFYIW